MAEFTKAQIDALLQAVVAQGSGVATDMTKKVHRTAYPAISPLRPELSQAGNTVLVTGGATNIGLAITKAFVQAGAKRVIIVGRRAAVLESAKEEILAEATKNNTNGNNKNNNQQVEVMTRSVDLTDGAAVRQLWAGLAQAGVAVDVLVLNAAQPGAFQSLLDMGADAVWERMEANVHGPLLMAELLAKQINDDGAEGRRRKCVVNVSSQMAHTFDRGENVLAGGMPSYNLSKAAGTLAMQLVAADADPARLTVVSLHPGVLYSDMWASVGVARDRLPFDDMSLPAGAAVWLASPEAAFLHGRFVWASWDVDELRAGELRRRVEEDVNFLRVGIIGLRNGHRDW